MISFSIYRFFVLSSLCFLSSCSIGWKYGYDYEDFKVNGIDATIIKPTIAPNGRWIVRPAFIGAYPYVDDCLLSQGYTVAFYDVTNEYGNVKAQNNFKDFLKYCRKKYNLNDKVILEGFSRGGFFVLCYAVNHPEDVEKIYVDNPVCNLRSWPMKQSHHLYVEAERKWKDCDCEIDSIYDYPIKNFDSIIKHNIPVVLVYGCQDTLVPYEENFGLIDAKGYENLYVIPKENVGHVPHSLKECERIVEFLKN